jgi:hypothetical protein
MKQMRFGVSLGQSVVWNELVLFNYGGGCQRLYTSASRHLSASLPVLQLPEMEISS